MSGPVGGNAVLVTGAAGGIGRACALEAARRGAAVVLTDIQVEPLAATAAEVGSLAGGSSTARRSTSPTTMRSRGSRRGSMPTTAASTWS